MSEKMSRLERFFDRLPVLPLWSLYVLCALFVGNALMRLSGAPYPTVPPWLSFPLVLLVFALLFRALWAKEQGAQRK